MQRQRERACALAVLFALCALPWLLRALLQPGVGHGSRSGVGGVAAVAPAHEPAAVPALLVISNFASYAPQVATLRCYAERQGLQFIAVDPTGSASCAEHESRQGSFFFRKHCIVREVLRSRPPRSPVFVFDADVVAVSDVPLTRWLSDPADLVFYDRWGFGEVKGVATPVAAGFLTATAPQVAAGNYMIRNTPFSLAFLLDWASYGFKQPPGFSSADNGAIHLVLLDALRLKSAQLCHRLYTSLDAPVDNLGRYWEFVGCVRALLGPSRRWRATAGGHLGRVTILSQAAGWVLDWGLLNCTGPFPFLHGVKNVTSESGLRLYNLSSTCLRASGLRHTTSRAVAGALALERELAFADAYARSVVPVWPTAHCLSDLSCAPLEDDEIDEGQAISLPFGNLNGSPLQVIIFRLRRWKLPAG